MSTIWVKHNFHIKGLKVYDLWTEKEGEEKTLTWYNVQDQLESLSQASVASSKITLSSQVWVCFTQECPVKSLQAKISSSLNILQDRAYYLAFRG